MNKLIAIFLIFLTGSSFANMASPVREGSLISSAFSSSDIDIIKEKLTVNISKDFTTADYIAEYFINTEIDGMQIPLLFHAADYKGDFRIFVDNKEVKILDVPEEFVYSSDSSFDKFSQSFIQDSLNNNGKRVTVKWNEKTERDFRLSELKYFQVNLSKGKHTIRAEYTANVWTDRSDWVKEYSFHYSLSPAKYWKSFGSLEIVVNSEDKSKFITTNLGEPSEGKSNSSAKWSFQSIPNDVFIISYIPETSSVAKFFMNNTPFEMSVAFFLMLMIIHIILIKIFRYKKPSAKFSLIVFAGSIIIPLITLLFYIFSYGITDTIIGQEASGYHGYTFLVLIFYPVFFVIYFLISLFADRVFKRKFKSLLKT
ncbi:MAG: hypothetical protein IPH77_09580 [Ignavibacteria bacterium]|nr:hypothetical protein [Ignavibacteria bacterium]